MGVCVRMRVTQMNRSMCVRRCAFGVMCAGLCAWCTWICVFCINTSHSITVLHLPLRGTKTLFYGGLPLTISKQQQPPSTTITIAILFYPSPRHTLHQRENTLEKTMTTVVALTWLPHSSSSYFFSFLHSIQTSVSTPDPPLSSTIAVVNGFQPELSPLRAPIPNTLISHSFLSLSYNSGCASVTRTRVWTPPQPQWFLS